MSGSLIEDLTGIVTEQLDEHANIREIEVLSYNGTEQQEHLIHPKLWSSSDADTTMQANLRGFSETTDSPQRKSATESVAEAAVRHLPEEIGVETVDVDMSPLGLSPLRTGRLVLGENRESVGENLAGNPVDRVIRQLTAASVPHVIQLLARGGSSGKYNVALRLLVLDVAAMSPLRTSFADMVSDGVKYDPAELFGDVGVTSNFQIPIKDYYKKQYRKYVPSPAKYRNRSDSLQARELYEGVEEYKDLLRGRSGYDPLYQDLVGYPRWPVTDIQLRQFATLSPRYYPESLWDTVGGRNPPTLVTRELFRAALGTDHGLGTDTTPLPDAYYQESASSGSEGHETRLQLLLQFYSEQGCEVERVDQDGQSLPDGRAYYEAIVRALEASNETLSKPAKLLVNRIRAVENNQPVTFAVKDEAQAQKLFEAMEQPFKECVEDGVVLNNHSGGVTLGDGATVLLPSQGTEATWVLNKNGCLRVSTRTGDAVFAEGDAEVAVDQYDYDAPRYVVEDGAYKVVSANGTEIETYPTKQAMLREWTQLQPPLVPTQLHYLADLVILYQAGDGFKRFDPDPRWTGSNQGKRDTYEAAMAEFLRKYTEEENGEEIKKSELYKTFDNWYRGMIDDAVLTADDEFLIKKNEIGRALPKELATKRREIDGSYEEFIKDRRFTFPPGLQSPEIPVFSDDRKEEGGEQDDEA
jgi:hypothetical protein